MNYRRKFKIQLNWIKLLLFTMATSFISYGQETSNSDDDIDQLLDELFFNDQQFVQDLLNAINQYDFLYTTTTLNSNTFFAGRDAGLDQINMIPQVSYFSSSCFNASVSAIYYESQNPNWDFVSLSAGYGNTIGKTDNFHYNASYSRFFYSDGWTDFNNSLDFMLGYRNDDTTFGATVSLAYIFGEENTIQVVPRLFGNLTLSRGLKSLWRFRPQLSFLVAEQTVISFIPPRPGQPPGIRIDENFNWLNTQLYLPISWSSASWDIELGWNLNLPKFAARETNTGNTSFFTLSVGYLIDFTKR